MDELTKLLMQRTGLSADQAKAVITTVVGYLKTRLPGAMGGEIDALLGGKTAGAEAEVAKDLEGLLSKR
jgi:hypothetical protein